MVIIIVLIAVANGRGVTGTWFNLHACHLQKYIDFAAHSDVPPVS